MTIASNKENRRLKILEAARTCLARFGFDKMTLDDVGKIVGLKKASLYYYYPNKEALVLDVILTESAEYFETLREKVEATSDCSERINTYLTERYRIFEKVINLHNLSHNNMLKLRPVFQELCTKCKDDEIAFIQKILDYCVQNGELKACNTHKIAASILAIAEAYKLHVLEKNAPNTGNPIDYSEIEDDVIFTVSLIIEGLKVAK